MEIRHMLSALWRTRTGPILIAVQIAAALAVLVNVTYMIRSAWRPPRAPPASTSTISSGSAPSHLRATTIRRARRDGPPVAELASGRHRRRRLRHSPAKLGGYRSALLRFCGPQRRQGWPGPADDRTGGRLTRAQTGLGTKLFAGVGGSADSDVGTALGSGPRRSSSPRRWPTSCSRRATRWARTCTWAWSTNPRKSSASCRRWRRPRSPDPSRRPGRRDRRPVMPPGP